MNTLNLRTAIVSILLLSGAVSCASDPAQKSNSFTRVPASESAGPNRCTSDTTLQKSIASLAAQFVWRDEACRKSDGGLAPQLGVDDSGEKLYSHDSVLPYVYTHAVPKCDGDFSSIRSGLAFFKDFEKASSSSYAGFESRVGYQVSSAESKAEVAAIGDGDLKSAFNQVLSGLGCTEYLGPDLQSAEDCKSTDFSDGRAASIQFATSTASNTSPWTVSAAVMKSINSILATSQSCSSKKAAVLAVFSHSMTTGDLDDFMVLTWMAQNGDALVHSDATRRLLAAATQLNKPIDGPEYDWTQGSAFSKAGDLFFMEAAVSTKVFLVGLTMNALKQNGANGYDAFSGLSSAAQAQVAANVQEGLNKGLSSSSYRDSVTAQERKDCNSKIASLLGGPGSQASATGDDWGESQTNGGVLTERFHTYKTMHMYPGDIVKSHGPIYAPKGYRTAGPGATADIGSFVLYYSALGRYRNVILNFNHLSDSQDLLSHRSCPTDSSCTGIEANAAGSVRAGSTGGDGGDGDGSYDHSHINMLASDGHTKLNFMDAFCK